MLSFNFHVWIQLNVKMNLSSSLKQLIHLKWKLIGWDSVHLLLLNILSIKLYNQNEVKTKMMLSHQLTFEVWTHQQSAYDWDCFGWCYVFFGLLTANLKSLFKVGMNLWMENPAKKVVLEVISEVYFFNCSIKKHFLHKYIWMELRHQVPAHGFLNSNKYKC